MADLLVSAIKSTTSANRIKERAREGELRARRRGDHKTGDKYQAIADRCDTRKNAFVDLLNLFKKCDGICGKSYLVLTKYRDWQLCNECLTEFKEQDAEEEEYWSRDKPW